MNSQMIQRFGMNLRGRDLVVGDIHGHFSKLQLALDAAGFSPENGDRLFSVGDLVDRGDESHLAATWLAQTWFHAVCGNHEQNLYDAAVGIAPLPNWFLRMPIGEAATLFDEICKLPTVIEIETPDGIVGIVHADSPYTVWPELLADLRTGSDQLARRCMTSRHRINSHSRRGVDGIRALVVGHTPVQRPYVLGNVHYIDTCGWRDEGYFTLLDLDTLAQAVSATEWSAS